jgi:hypothetical protein
MEIPLDGLPVEGVDVRRRTRDRATLNPPRSRQLGHVPLGMQALTREGWKHFTGGQRDSIR